MPRSPAVENAARLLALGKAAEASDALRQYLRARPRDGDAACLLAEVHNVLGEHELALRFIERAAIVGQDARVHVVRGAALAAVGEAAEADTNFTRALVLSNGDPAVLRAWAAAAVQAGRPGDAARLLEQFLPDVGDDPSLLQSLCYARNVVGGGSPESERLVHERLAAATGVRAAQPRSFPNDRDPERTLRVAFLSADYRLHSCAFFLEPLLAALDHGRVTPLLYSTTPDPDAVTQRFRALGEWRDCGRLSADELAALARRDRVDILVDANGWTVASQMRAVIARLAPLQVSYLGYPNTTGAVSVDWRVVDAHSDPAGSEAACTERLWRLENCFVCFAADPAWPPPTPTTFQRGAGGAMFGSFNNAAKITPEVVQVWARALTATPGSRLLVKAAGLSGARATRLRRAFADAGIEPDRLDPRPFVPDTAAHVGLYNEVDIALDTFPYNGTTTTCEALWMGVPVITLAGDRHRARVGVSLLNSVGAPELVATDADGYVALVARLARDLPRLRSYRETLRDRMAASSLCDAAGYARRFEEALRGMWLGWTAS